MRYTGRVSPIAAFIHARSIRGEVSADARLRVEWAVGGCHDGEGAFFLSRMSVVRIWRGKGDVQRKLGCRLLFGFGLVVGG